MEFIERLEKSCGPIFDSSRVPIAIIIICTILIVILNMDEIASLGLISMILVYAWAGSLIWYFLAEFCEHGNTTL